MTGDSFIARTGRRTVFFLLILSAVVGIGIMPFYYAGASHLDPAVLADQDGALDNDAHVEGVRRALRENWVAGFMMMTEQFVTIMMQQMLITATFFDAAQQLEVQRIFQELAAQAHKDFHPSFQMCTFGTTVRSLVWAEQTAWENTRLIDQMMEKREHLHANLSAAGGTTLDVTHRIEQFKATYCDLAENNQTVDLLCNNTAGPINRRTKDIDYLRLVDNAYTLDLNYYDGVDTETEMDVMALGRNIYGSAVVDFIPEQLFNTLEGQDLWMETRSIHAIRSVARRSFATVVGMKAEGDQNDMYEVRPFLFGIIRELGVPEAEITQFLGENPSYFAQMEVLTRKIYQSPEFFTNLYDKPVNVKRIGVALQAIELMQDRDRFESALRREMLISLILELKLRKYQENMNSVLYSTVNRRFGPDEW